MVDAGQERKTMRILICDDQAITREGLAMLLNLERDIEVVGMAEDGAQAVELTVRLAPDLVLMDLKMPGVNGVEATRQLRTWAPQTKILVLTTYDDDAWVREAIRAGAAGYLLKDTSREELIKAVRGTLAGKSYIDPAVAGRVLTQMNAAQEAGVTPVTLDAPTTSPTTSAANAPFTPVVTLPTPVLTFRQQEVIKLVIKGLSNKEIAQQLGITERTVKFHVGVILESLQVRNRYELAQVAQKLAL